VWTPILVVYQAISKNRTELLGRACTITSLSQLGFDYNSLGHSFCHLMGLRIAVCFLYVLMRKGKMAQYVQVFFI